MDYRAIARHIARKVINEHTGVIEAIICERCGKHCPDRGDAWEADHKDGNHDNNAADNLQALCIKCHHLKTAFQGIYRVLQKEE